jgi:hypothetical protein
MAKFERHPGECKVRAFFQKSPVQAQPGGDWLPFTIACAAAAHDERRSQLGWRALLIEGDIHAAVLPMRRNKCRAVLDASAFVLQFLDEQALGNILGNHGNKPETKKIGVDLESMDALLVDLFLEAHIQAPDRIILDLDAPAYDAGKLFDKGPKGNLTRTSLTERRACPVVLRTRAAFILM